MEKQEFKNNFISGELGIEFKGRIDLGNYTNGLSKLENGTPNVQGSLTNKTLKVSDPTFQFGASIGSGAFYSVNSFNSGIKDEFITIIYQELISRDIHATVFDKVGTLLKDSKVETKTNLVDVNGQINNVAFLKLSDETGNYKAELKGNVRSATRVYEETIKITNGVDPLITVNGITSETATVTQVGAISPTGVITLNVESVEESRVIKDAIARVVIRKYLIGETPDTSITYSEVVSSDTYTGELPKIGDTSFEKGETSLTTPSPTPLPYEPTPTELLSYYFDSERSEYKSLDPVTLEEINVIEYKNIKTEKIPVAKYEGIIFDSYFSNIYEFDITNTKAIAASSSTIGVMNLLKDGSGYDYIDGTIKSLPEFLNKQPTGKDLRFGDTLVDSIPNLNKAVWKHKVGENFLTIKFYQTAPQEWEFYDIIKTTTTVNEYGGTVTINSVPVQMTEGQLLERTSTYNSTNKTTTILTYKKVPKLPTTGVPVAVSDANKEKYMYEIYVQGGVARWVEGDKWAFTKATFSDTSEVNETTGNIDTVWKPLELSTVWFTDMVDVSKVQNVAIFDGRLVLANLETGSNLIVFSTRNDIRDFSIKGLGVDDPTITEINSPGKVSIDKIVSYKTLMFFTDKGIYGQAPGTIANIAQQNFSLLSKVTPSPDIPVSFLNEEMAFVNINKNRIFSIGLSDAGASYNITDLSVVNPRMFKNISGIANVGFNNDTGYSTLLVNAENISGIVTYIKSDNVLAFSRANFNKSGFGGLEVYNGVTYSVNHAEGNIYKVEETFSDEMIFETLPSKTNGSYGEPAILTNNFNTKSLKIFCYGKYSFEVAGETKVWQDDPLFNRDYSVVEFPNVNFGVNENFTIKVNTNEEIIIFGILTTVEVA